MSDRPTSHEGTVIAILLFVVGAMTSAVSILAWVGPPMGGFGIFLSVLGALVIPAALVVTLTFKAKTLGWRQLIAISLLVAIHSTWLTIAIASGRGRSEFAGAALTLLGGVNVPMLSAILVEESAPKAEFKAPTPTPDPTPTPTTTSSSATTASGDRPGCFKSWREDLQRQNWRAADCVDAYERKCSPDIVAVCGERVPDAELGTIIELAARDLKAQHAAISAALPPRCESVTPYVGGALDRRQFGSTNSRAELLVALPYLDHRDLDIRASALMMFRKGADDHKGIIDDDKLRVVARSLFASDNAYTIARGMWTRHISELDDTDALVAALLRLPPNAFFAGWMQSDRLTDAHVEKLLPLAHVSSTAPVCEAVRQAEITSALCLTLGSPHRNVPGAFVTVKRSADEIAALQKRAPDLAARGYPLRNCDYAVQEMSKRKP